MIFLHVKSAVLFKLLTIAFIYTKNQ